jgi:CubicO group peptidase (beta-lactamase class C family)
LFAALPVVVLAVTAASLPQLRNLVVYGPGVGAGIAAELGCAGVFVMGRRLENVVAQDLVPFDPLLARAALSVDETRQTATARLFGVVARTAIYRPGLGCTLLNERDEASLHGQAAGLQLMSRQERPAPWPEGDIVDLDHLPGSVDAAALDKAVTEAFRETALGGRIDTRALVVAYRGRIVAERYAAGFGPNSRLLGWSMGKSVTSALIGTLVADGKLALDGPPPVASFRRATDGREAITLRQLLQMRSGLAFEESYGPGDDSTAMLFGEDDMAAYAATRKLIHPPGTVWSYSSGTANMLAHLIFDAAGGNLPAAYAYARTRLFEPAGMTSAVFEPDGTGAFVGSSYLYMTARDWARFGELYLDRGSINGEHLLSADWIEFSRTGGGPIGEPGGYGAMWWLNSDGGNPERLRWPDCPPDTYMALGHNDEIVAIVPSRHTVIVRLGWTTGGAEFDANSHFSQILASLHDDR